MKKITRYLVALVLMLGMFAGLAGSAEAHYTGADHWDFWPGYASIGWQMNCAAYAPDLGLGKNGANCHFKAPVCALKAGTGYRLAQYVDVYWPNGDQAFNRGPAWSTTACTP